MRNHQNNHISDENLNLLLQDVFFFNVSSCPPLTNFYSWNRRRRSEPCLESVLL